MNNISLGHPYYGCAFSKNPSSLHVHMTAHKSVNFVLKLATLYNALECKHNVCEASVHIAQISVTTAGKTNT